MSDDAERNIKTEVTANLLQSPVSLSLSEPYVLFGPTGHREVAPHSEIVICDTAMSSSSPSKKHNGLPAAFVIAKGNELIVRSCSSATLCIALCDDVLLLAADPAVLHNARNEPVCIDASPHSCGFRWTSETPRWARLPRCRALALTRGTQVRVYHEGMCRQVRLEFSNQLAKNYDSSAFWNEELTGAVADCSHTAARSILEAFESVRIQMSGVDSLVEAAILKNAWRLGDAGLSCVHVEAGDHPLASYQRDVSAALAAAVGLPLEILAHSPPDVLSPNFATASHLVLGNQLPTTCGVTSALLREAQSYNETAVIAGSISVLIEPFQAYNTTLYRRAFPGSWIIGIRRRILFSPFAFATLTRYFLMRGLTSSLAQTRACFVLLYPNQKSHTHKSLKWSIIFSPNLEVVDTDAFSLVESLVISASGAGVSGMAMYMLVREKVYMDIGTYRSASVLYGQSNRWLSPTRLATAASKVECPRISLKKHYFLKCDSVSS